MAKETVEQQVQQLMDLEAQAIQLVCKQRLALDVLQAAAQARLEAYRRVHGLLQEAAQATAEVSGDGVSTRGASSRTSQRPRPKGPPRTAAEEILSAVIEHMVSTPGRQSVRAIHRGVLSKLGPGITYEHVYQVLRRNLPDLGERFGVERFSTWFPKPKGAKGGTP